MIFGKRKGLTTNPATRPFWVVAGSGMDVKGKFGESLPLWKRTNNCLTIYNVLLGTHQIKIYHP